MGFNCNELGGVELEWGALARSNYTAFQISAHHPNAVFGLASVGQNSLY
jgi:hypothetical protein